MPTDPRVDAYIAKAAPFAQPILKHIRTPPFLAAALKKNPKALRNYEAFPPSHKREYVEWLTEARTIETRDRRLAQAIAWIAAGKGRNWKYQR